MSDMMTSPSGPEPESRWPLLILSIKQGWKSLFRRIDVIHLTLAGMEIIVIAILVMMGMSVFGFMPPFQPALFVGMAFLSLADTTGLYFINLRIHKSLSDQTRLTEVLVNSLGQGFLLFNEEGVCGPVYSEACVDLLEIIPAGRMIVDVLRVPESEQVVFKDWLGILFIPHHALGFDDVVRFMPQSFSHSHGKRISLMYRPIYDKTKILTQVVVIATDETEEFESNQKAQQQQSYADMICLIFKERNQFLATITHVRKFIEAAGEAKDRETAPSMLRALHTLKAAVKHFHLDALGKVMSDLESSLRAESLISDSAYLNELSIGRKQIEKSLLSVMTQVNELIGHDYEDQGNMREIEEAALYNFARVMQNGNIERAMIHRFLMDIAAVPATECFRLFEREVRDLAEIMGKQIKPLRYTGSNPKILMMPIQEFLFSLTHISRNIIDHGIEASVTRLARGKDPAGQISIHVEIVEDQENNTQWLHLIISDDGNGIDPEKVRKKLEQVDPKGAWRELDDHGVIQHIFSWGFSTREKITDLSGRGVGLEAVHREVQLLGGQIKVYSELQRGTRFDIRVPYTFDLPDNEIGFGLPLPAPNKKTI